MLWSRAVNFTVYLKYVCIIYRIVDSIVPLFFIIINISLLFRYIASNFTERFNDTLIWYSFKRAPSNFTSSQSETLYAIVATSSPVFALDRDFAGEYLQFR